ncbi:cytochrome P450 [Hygrophoropsis aurantiaca]|uniref:Cytochrome P450 n=1 Tax=Hygrophoropsis aurantiaca TaxID=72124 RepID=A0ACB7ZTW4_9AGAM|nr:cytochrome P450 [Hygrophoropsis aurantiaca]
MEIPPGLIYFILNFHRLMLPPALAYCAIRLLHTITGISLSEGFHVPLYIASLPLAFTSTVLYAEYNDKRQAAARGAVLAPRVQSRWPGGLDILAKLVGNFKGGDMMNNEMQIHGNTINIRTLFENRIFTTEPEYIKAILATQFNSFAKGPLFWDQVNSLLGTGVFNSDGDMWKFHRSMTRPFFNKDRISHFDIFEKHAEDAINQTKARLREGYPIDFQDMVSRFTLDSATEFLFGKDVCSLSAGLIYPASSPLSKSVAFKNHPANIFAHAFAEAQIAAAYRGSFGSFWRLFEFGSDRIKKHMNICYQFIDPILKEALQKKKDTKKLAGNNADAKEREVNEGETLLDHLVNYTEDPVVIRDEILNIMIAGRDTTAGTLTFIVYMLSQHPKVLLRLREEILNKIGSSKRPSYDEMRDMKYMRAVINETLRLYPSPSERTFCSYFFSRTTTESVILPAINGGKPIYVPPNTRMPYSVFLMHRRKDLWGPDAEEFDPDRFLDERLHKYLTKNPFIFAPFNAGPRICLGQQFAYNEMSYFLVRLLQTFSTVSLATDTQAPPPAEWAKATGRKAIEKVVIKAHLTMYAPDGVWVKMGEASHVEVV